MMDYGMPVKWVRATWVLDIYQAKLGAEEIAQRFEYYHGLYPEIPECNINVYGGGAFLHNGDILTLEDKDRAVVLAFEPDAEVLDEERDFFDSISEYYVLEFGDVKYTCKRRNSTAFK